MIRHNLLVSLIISALWIPVFPYSMIGIRASDSGGYNHDKSYRSYRKSFCLSRSKTEFNPYRIVKNIIPIIYEEVPESSVLLSVDLGLRSGFAFYNSTGSLLGFRYHRFESVQTLKDSILVELMISSVSYNLNHFVLEGDTIYGGIWAEAIKEYSIERNKIVKIIYVSPAEWRKRILLKKESKSGKDAKYAAREISRQIMWRSGMDATYYNESMNTDAAEAILIGHYAVNDKLKWKNSHGDGDSNSDRDRNKNLMIASNIQNEESLILNSSLNLNSHHITDTPPTMYKSKGSKELFSAPLIERFSNGNVVLPPK